MATHQLSLLGFTWHKSCLFACRKLRIWCRLFNLVLSPVFPVDRKRSFMCLERNLNLHRRKGSNGSPWVEPGMPRLTVAQHVGSPLYQEPGHPHCLPVRDPGMTPVLEEQEMSLMFLTIKLVADVWKEDGKTQPKALRPLRFFHARKRIVFDPKQRFSLSRSFRGASTAIMLIRVWFCPQPGLAWVTIWEEGPILPTCCYSAFSKSITWLLSLLSFWDCCTNPLNVATFF